VEFEWDETKAAENVKPHGITFSEASSAFEDPLSRTIADPANSEIEDRFVLVGSSVLGRLVVVVHTDRAGHTRIISARHATQHERRDYEERP
jgi:uncharacterized DUF497 family protein